MHKTTKEKTLTAYWAYTHPDMEVFILPLRDRSVLPKRVQKIKRKIQVSGPIMDVVKDLQKKEERMHLNEYLIRKIQKFVRIKEDSLLHFPAVWKNQTEKTVWVTACDGWQAYLYTEHQWAGYDVEEPLLFPRVWDFFPQRFFEEYDFILYPDINMPIILVTDSISGEAVALMWWTFTQNMQLQHDEVFTPLFGKVPPGRKYEYVGEVKLRYTNPPYPHNATVSRLDGEWGVVGGKTIEVIPHVRPETPIEVYGDLSVLIHTDPIYYEVFKYTMENSAWYIFMGEKTFIREVYVFPKKR